MFDYIAHSHGTAPPHRLSHHLESTARRAEQFTDKLGLLGWGRALGLLHDLGKYSDAFQARVRGQDHHVDHSTFGAQVAEQQFGRRGRLLSYNVAGHHGGLPNGTGQGSTLLSRLSRSDLPDARAFLGEIVLPVEISEPSMKEVRIERLGFALSQAIRMAFSALIDADHLDTEAYYAEAGGYRVERGNWPSLGDIARQVDRHMATFTADTPVRAIRAEVLQAAREAGALAPGLFSMTVPTGGGKTLASLVWALLHARCYGLDRIIIAIPFTSIVEQTAEVIRKALGSLGDCVIEHHSAFVDRGVDGPRTRRAVENWDAPIIVTTNVQLYESLYSNLPGRCRKLHNMARSVIIIDEAQSLPVDLLMPCVAMLQEMARSYRTSILLCTATQPALMEIPDNPRSSLAGGLRQVREIAPKGLHDRLRRVKMRFAGRMADDDLIAELQGCSRSLVIVNTRRHARDLYLAARHLDGAAHLSALMCPAHRSAKLSLHRAVLADQNEPPLRLITTSLIEAGVDVDFPKVWREIAGLSSIAQAAGRCNREGLRDPAESVVTVFEPKVELGHIAREIAATRSVLAPHADDPLSPDAIEAYFATLYWRHANRRGGLDKYDILSRFEAQRGELLFPFADIAQSFRLIDGEQVPIIVPWDETACNLIRELARAETARGIARQLQRYTVSISAADHTALVAAGAIVEASAGRFDAEFWVLTDTSRYSDELGLELEG